MLPGRIKGPPHRIEKAEAEESAENNEAISMD